MSIAVRAKVASTDTDCTATLPDLTAIQSCGSVLRERYLKQLKFKFMISQIKSLFKIESYPDFQNEWDNPKNTVYREFYITNSYDFDILCDLVKKHMSDKGNEGVERYRLIKLLQDESNRAFYLMYQKRMHPYTYLIKWKLRLLREFFHRRFNTKKFRCQVELSRMAKDVVSRMEKTDNE